MALVAAAVCPHPPMLVPELASGAAPELDRLRAHCVTAVESLFERAPDLLFVVGADSQPHATTLAPWGVDIAVDVPESLPLSLLIGGWLTRGHVRSFLVVADDLDPAECAELGREVATGAARVAMLVMGDGSGRHSEKAPGYIDPRAASYDAEVARALHEADADALLALDSALSAELLVAGRAPWQVLAGAAAGQRWRVEAAHLEAPYGVGYHVAAWRQAERPGRKRADQGEQVWRGVNGDPRQEVRTCRVGGITSGWPPWRSEPWPQEH